MNILALDTSAVSASVSILKDDFLLGEFYINTKLTHSQTIMVMLENLLKVQMMTIKDIDLFAVNVGPGSFTGIRIGVSAVKGMAMVNDTPCVAVSTLYSMAQNLVMFNGIICSVMDARCNQVYNALFKCTNGKISRINNDRAILIEDLKAELSNYNEQIYLVGDGADICYKVMNDLSNIHISSQNLKYQHSYGVGVCALEMYNKGEYTSSEMLVPSYLKLPQAERELKNKLSKGSADK